MVETILALTARTGTGQGTAELVAKLNRTLRGWANYFNEGTVTKTYRAIDNYTAVRLRRWLRIKHRTDLGPRCGRWPDRRGLGQPDGVSQHRMLTVRVVIAHQQNARGRVYQEQGPFLPNRGPFLTQFDVGPG
jgi:hypothetical protein